nr:hypothetical protein GCM10020092_071640 [Actinoplanes digitatis]
MTPVGDALIVSGPDGTDTLRNIERLAFADQTVEVTAPTAYSGVSALAGDAKATVVWTLPENTSGAIVTGHQVEVNDGTAVRLIDAPADATSLVVNGLTNGVPVTFRVRAVTADGPGEFVGPSEPVTPQGGRRHPAGHPNHPAGHPSGDPSRHADHPAGHADHPAGHPDHPAGHAHQAGDAGRAGCAGDRHGDCRATGPSPSDGRRRPATAAPRSTGTRCRRSTPRPASRSTWTSPGRAPPSSRSPTWCRDSRTGSGSAR